MKLSHRINKIALVLLALLGLQSQVVQATTYNVAVTRIGQNFYSIAGSNVILQTKFCYEYAYGESAVLTMTGYTGSYDGSIKFSSNQTCDVAGAYGPSTLSAGIYSATLTIEDPPFYSDWLQKIIVRASSTCFNYQYYATSSIAVTYSGLTYLGGLSLGTISFPYGSSCTLTGIYWLTNLAGSTATVPGAPTNLVTTPGNGSATISFSAPASNGGSAITGYTATCGSKTGTGTASPITVIGLTNGMTYSCSVTATNGVGTGAASSSVSVTPIGPSASTAYNIPAPTNVDQPYVRIYNPSSTAGAVRATLHDQNGVVLGTANSTLVSNISAHSVTVVTASDIANAVGVTTWTGRAWMKLEADFLNVKAMNLIRSSLLLSMSCLEADKAYYIPSPSATAEQAYIRLYNTSNTAGAVSGTLYDENGNVLGTAGSVLVTSLAGNAVTVLSAADLATAVGVSSWMGRAWLSISTGISGLRVMNTLRDLSTDTLVNVSCDVGSTGTSADILNIPSPTSTTSATIRIYNTSSSTMVVTGTLYAETGATLGVAANLGTIPAKGVLVLSNSAIASAVGASSWSGRAWMRVSFSVTGLKVLALTRQQSLMEMSCSESGYAFNIPDASNAQDHPFIRLYNTGASAGSVYGTLYDQNGNVLGTANSLLVLNMPAMSATQLTASNLASYVGSNSWSGRSWLKIESAPTGLKILNILEDQASGNLANMSCITN